MPVWNVEPGQRHSDNYEMSGLFCDCIVDYGVNADGSLLLGLSCYFPTLRTIPNDTHGTLGVRAEYHQLPALRCNGKPVVERPRRFLLDGTLICESETDHSIRIRRQILPSESKRCCVQVVTVTAGEKVELTVSQPQSLILDQVLGTKGVYISRLSHNAPQAAVLLPGETLTFVICISADIAHQDTSIAGEDEMGSRYRRIRELCDHSLVVDTGMPVLDAMARFARLRAGESIFQTLTGKYHSPGGRTYYAAIWCNDQIEYVGPYFAMTGDATAIEASVNAYRAYIPYMGLDYAPIPSSVIAEGLDIWNGAGDRGDAAMYLYGASAFCLALGDEKIARELYPAIRWCAEYCRRRESPEGVICSESDELEGRIPTDRYANLSTSSLCCGGLFLASKLAESLGDTDMAVCYCQRAQKLAAAIESYFGAQLHGFHTYRYSKGFDTLRAWICLPLCMGLTQRANGTMEALLSPYLWTEEGMLSCELSEDNRDSTIWDRSTLYGFRAAFLCGYGDRIMEPLLRYCRKRLLCDRVPYAVEAYPEGGKRQLSGESALFMRLITEGLLGIAPESLDSFSFVPRLPAEMPYCHLSNLHIAGACWEIRVEKAGWTVLRNGTMVASGDTDGIRVVMKASAEKV